MGAFLSKPITDVATEYRHGNGLQLFAGAVQGWRVGMEDAHAFRMQLVDNVDSPLNKWSAFCLFDGHAGAGAAMYCAENLLSDLLQHPSMQFISRNNNNNSGSASTAADSAKSSTQSNNTSHNNNSLSMSAIMQQPGASVDALVEAALKDVFVQIDSKYRDSLDRIVSADHSGTTGVCCLISPQSIYIANCGDSRAIVTSGGHRPFGASISSAVQQQQQQQQHQVVLATRDHKPDNPEERERIEKGGGSVVMGRVQGNLAVSRAIGDFDYKNNVDLPPTEQLVSCVPDVYVRKRDRTSDQFVVIACDGLWDVFHNQEAADFVWHLLTTIKPGADQCQRLMERLLRTAINKDSRDNITALIVGLDAMPQYDVECETHDAVCDNFIQHKIADYIDRNAAKDPTHRDVLSMLVTLEHIPNLPPGGGLVSKYDLIEQEFHRHKSLTVPVQSRMRSPSPSNSSTGGLAVPVVGRESPMPPHARDVPQQQQQPVNKNTTSSATSGARKSNNNTNASGHPEVVAARDSERMSTTSSNSTRTGGQSTTTTTQPIHGRAREITIVVEPPRVSGENSQRTSSSSAGSVSAVAVNQQKRLLHTYSISQQQSADGTQSNASSSQAKDNNSTRASERSQNTANNSSRPSNSSNSNEQSVRNRGYGNSSGPPPDNSTKR